MKDHKKKSKTSVEEVHHHESINDINTEISGLRAALPQILAVSVKNLLLLGYGMTLGFPTIVIPAIQGGEGREPSIHNEFVLNKEQISWFSSINLMCVPLGSIFSGALTQPIGRKRAMQIINIPFLGAWLCFYFSTNIYHLYAGLCLAGIAGGLMEAPVLTYVAEITQPRYRGILASTGATCALCGILIQFVLGTFLPWRTIALLSCSVPILSTIALLFVPESPHWLIMKQKYERAKKNLQWLRGWVTFDQVENEYNELYKVLSAQAEVNRNTNLLDKAKLYKKSSFLIPYGIISFTFFIAHFCGMTPLQTYAVQIFHTLKAPIDKYYATMLLGIAELAGTITCVILVHFTGKRPLVFFSTIGCGSCFFGAATYAFFLDSVPGTAVGNIVANLSALNQKPYLQEIKFNATKLNLNENNLTDFGYDYDTSTILSLINTTDYDSEFDDNNNNSNSNNNNNYTKYYFDNQEFSLLSVNETYDDGYIDPNNITLKKIPDLDDVSVVPKSIFVPISNTTENNYVWVPMVLLIGSAYLSHAAVKLIPWLLIGELYPPSVRSGAAGFSGGTGYVFGFLSNKLFLTMVSTLSLPGTFWFYSCVSLFGAFILFFILPETEGKTLMEIENNLKRKKREHFNEENPATELPYIRNPDRIKTPKSIQEKLENTTEQTSTTTPPPTVPLKKQNLNNIPIKKQKSNETNNKTKTTNTEQNTINNDKDKTNFDVKNWESNLIFQRHLEQAKNIKNNNNLTSEMDTINEGIPVQSQMGVKKTKIKNNKTQKNNIVEQDKTDDKSINDKNNSINHNNNNSNNIKNDEDDREIYDTSL